MEAGNDGPAETKKRGSQASRSACMRPCSSRTHKDIPLEERISVKYPAADDQFLSLKVSISRSSPKIIAIVERFKGDFAVGHRGGLGVAAAVHPEQVKELLIFLAQRAAEGPPGVFFGMDKLNDRRVRYGPMVILRSESAVRSVR